MHPLRRGLPLIALLTLIGAPPASAQTSNPTTDSPLVPADFQIRVSKLADKEFVFITSDVERDRFFNRARCECKTPIRIRADMTASGTAKRSLITKGTVEIRVGNSDCVTADPTNFRNAKCLSLGTARLTDLAAKGKDADTDVSALFNAPNVTNGASCAVQFPQTVWLMVDTNEDMIPDMAFSDTNAPKLAVYLDGQGPPAPVDVKVSSGNEALSVSWTRNGLVEDQGGFVVFCSRAGLPVFKNSFYSDNEYSNQKTLCPNGIGQAATALDAIAQTTTSGTPIDAQAEFRDLDPRFVCSDLLTTGNSVRIRGLQNQIPYLVGVAAVDTRGNASPIEMAIVQSPIPTRDFYRAYQDAGGEASGCAFGHRGRAGAGALAVLILALGLAARRRR
jgi:hypothetical protein